MYHQRNRLARWSFCILMLALATQASAAYEPQVGDTLYRVILWRGGDPATAVTVIGQADALDAGKAEHTQCGVQLSCETKDNGTHWRITVTPKADWGVAEVHYPMLHLPKLQNDYIVAGQRTGQRMPLDYVARNGEHPHGWAFRSEMAGVIDLTTKSALYWGRYPSSELTLQMITYENDQQGVMIWTPDDQSWVKDFLISGSDLPEVHQGKAYRAYVTHLPENTGQPGAHWDSPYPVVTTPYAGGWQQAARVYRNWAVKQWWCEAGPVYKRPTTPGWFKDIHLWAGIAGRPYWIDTMVERIAPLVGDRVIGYQWSGWSDYDDAGVTAAPQMMPAFDEPGFRRIIALRDQGWHAAPYFIFSVATINDEPAWHQLKHTPIRHVDGSISTMYTTPSLKQILDERPHRKTPPSILKLAQNFVDYRQALLDAWNEPVQEQLIERLTRFPMPPSVLGGQQLALRRYWGKSQTAIDRLRFYTPWAKTDLNHPDYLNFVVDQVDRAVRTYDLKMVYFDTYPHTPIPNFNPPPGVPIGYGPHIAAGNRKLCTEVLKRHPSLILTCESGANESLLDVMHLTYHKGINPVYAIPLFATVYNGYIAFTNWWMWPPYRSQEDFTSNVAYGMHLGYMPGGAAAAESPTYLAVDEKRGRDDSGVRFMLEAVDLRSQYRDYLAVGRRLDDPTVEGVEPQICQWSAKGSGTAREIELTPVMASMWSHPDNDARVLMLVSNHDAKPHTVHIDGRTIEMLALSWKAIEIHAP